MVKEYHNLQDLEYDLCIDFGEVDSVEETNFRQLSVDFCKIVRIVEDGLVGNNRRWVWFDKDEIDVKIGETIVYEEEDNKVKWYSKVDVDKVNKLNEELARVDMDCGEDEFYGLVKDGRDIVIVGVEFIKKYQEKKREERAKEEEEEKKERERELKEKRKKDKLYQSYIKDSVVFINKVKIDVNTMTKDNNVLILKDKKINEVVSYDLVEKIGNYWADLQGNILPLLITKQVDFDFNGVKVDFNPTKINGIRARKNRIMPIVNALRKNKSIDIKQYNTFSQMAIDLMDRKSLEVYNDAELDVEFVATNKDNWKVTIFSRVADFTWNEIKEIFFYQSSRSCNSSLDKEQIFKLATKIGLTKQELFDYIKKNRILNKLKEKDES